MLLEIHINYLLQLTFYEENIFVLRGLLPLKCVFIVKTLLLIRTIYCPLTKWLKWFMCIVRCTIHTMSKWLTFVYSSWCCDHNQFNSIRRIGSALDSKRLSMPNQLKIDQTSTHTENCSEHLLLATGKMIKIPHTIFPFECRL